MTRQLGLCRSAQLDAVFTSCIHFADKMWSELAQRFTAAPPLPVSLFNMLGRSLHGAAGHGQHAALPNARQQHIKRSHVSVRAAEVVPPPQMQILEDGRNTNEPPATTQAAAEFLRQELKTIFRTGVSAFSAHACVVLAAACHAQSTFASSSSSSSCSCMDPEQGFVRIIRLAQPCCMSLNQIRYTCAKEDVLCSSIVNMPAPAQHAMYTV
jgi:hypothetical protein